MTYDLVIAWLEVWRRKSIASGILAAVGGLILSLILLALAWVFIFMVSLQVVGGWVPFSAAWIHLLIPTVGIPLLFVGNACVSQETLGKYSFTTGTVSNKVVTVPGYGSNINPLASNSIISVLKMIADVLFCGPRVAVWSIRRIVYAIRLVFFDVLGCAAAITVLYDADGRMSYEEINESVEGLDPVRAFQQLRLLDGVVYLESEPRGLSLGTELRKELSRIC